MVGVEKKKNVQRGRGTNPPPNNAENTLGGLRGRKKSWACRENTNPLFMSKQRGPKRRDGPRATADGNVTSQRIIQLNETAVRHWRRKKEDKAIQRRTRPAKGTESNRKTNTTPGGPSLEASRSGENGLKFTKRKKDWGLSREERRRGPIKTEVKAAPHAKNFW